jgi:hypothetical protein
LIGANCGHFLATQTAQAREQVERILGWIAVRNLAMLESTVALLLRYLLANARAS